MESVTQKPKRIHDLDEDTDEWPSDSDASSESESDLDFEGKQMEELRRFFLKSFKHVYFLVFLQVWSFQSFLKMIIILKFLLQIS